MDKLDTVLSQLTEQLAKLTVEHGPKATELVLEVMRMKAISFIAETLIWLLISLGVVYVCYKAYGREKEKDYYREQDDLILFGSVFGGVISTVFSCFNLITLTTSIQHWVGMFKPEVLLAYEIMHRVLK